MTPPTDWPTPEEETHLLIELLSGSPTAREELAVRFQPLLMRHLACAFPRVAADARDTAADDALLSFLAAPARYDPARGRLGAYLRMSARGDLRNLLARNRRADLPLDSVAEPVAPRNLSRGDEPTWDHPPLKAELAALDPLERVALELMQRGTRDTATFAGRLGFEHLPRAEQAAAVKRIKDRVMKRLTRAVGDSR